MAEELKGLDDVPVAQVNCAANPKMQTKFGVTGYPQVKMIANKRVGRNFERSRTKENILNFVKKWYKAKCREARLK